MNEEKTQIKPCPFCGAVTNDYGTAHTDECYFTVQRLLNNAPDGDLSLVPVVLDAWNRRASPSVNEEKTEAARGVVVDAPLLPGPTGCSWPRCDCNLRGDGCKVAHGVSVLAGNVFPANTPIDSGTPSTPIVPGKAGR